jgi:hypothetical protein
MVSAAACPSVVAMPCPALAAAVALWPLRLALALVPVVVMLPL